MAAATAATTAAGAAEVHAQPIVAAVDALLAAHPYLVRHPQGFVVLAAPGAGKTWFVARNPGWYDADILLGALGVHTLQWHAVPHTPAETEAHYRLCDAYTYELRARGLWFVSSLFWAFVPDVIVILDPAVHRARVAQRGDLDWDMVRAVVRVLERMAADYGVPRAPTLEAAAALAHAP